jgi:hypothetical protein
MSDDANEPREENVKRVRVGHGANCSSVGSVIDVLFASAVAGSALYAAVAAALAKEEVEIVGGAGSERNEQEPDRRRDGARERRRS